MALTGIQIFKLLPKTNCKKCGFPTCLAFAMKLAQGGVELSACPDVSEEAKNTLGAAKTSCSGMTRNLLIPVPLRSI